ncbi:MAG TPA: DUF2933 domain-containing protein [Candidatus Methylomirabilis sp.]|nr:DUF2933 domain-containing protein [Candidatus Methylomirabilis sp.]
MSEFLQDYGFFIVIGILMLACHLWHGGHGGHGKRGDDKGSGSGHRH